MGLLILFIILALVALGLWIGKRFFPPNRGEAETRNRYQMQSAVYWRRGFVAAAVVLAFFAVLSLFFSTFRRVNTKEIGVPVTFGKVGSTHYGAGPHWPVAPWTKVVEIDGAIQTLDHLGENNCLNVRIANNQTGCAEVSIQWRVNPSQVDYLYKNYRSFSHIEKQLVDRKLFNATNEALASYNPLASISAKGVSNPLPAFATKIFDGMKAKVQDINGKPLIEILNVQLPYVHFDPKTQDRVNQLQQQVAQTAIANQREKTNAAESKANAALTQQKNGLSELVLVSRCIDWLETQTKASLTVPAGFSCWPGGNANFGGVVATTK